MSERVVIIGAGGHGKVLADIVRAAGDEVIGFLDDDKAKTEWYGDPVIGSIADAETISGCFFLLAIGDNAARRRIAETRCLPWYTAIHPSAVVSPSASVGEGSVVMPGAVINADAEIGRHCIVNTRAVVEHDNRIGDYVHLSPGAVLGGTVTIGDETHVGLGAAIRTNVSVCGGCTVGMGAAVVEDVNTPGTYVGVPARRLK